MERIHERTDQKGEVLFQTGRKGSLSARQAQPLAGMVVLDAVPKNIGSNRRKRLQQLHKASLRREVEETSHTASCLHQSYIGTQSTLSLTAHPAT